MRRTVRYDGMESEGWFEVDLCNQRGKDGFSMAVRSNRIGLDSFVWIVDVVGLQWK